MLNINANAMKFLVKKAFTMVVFLLTVLQIWAQPETIRGTVTDNEGGPVPGANLYIKGTISGTTSDMEGNFYFAHPVSPSDTLVVSFIGYQSQEIHIGEQRQFNIVLAPEEQTIEELVVIGYGKQKQADLTGSVSTIQVEDLARVPVANLNEGLQGLSAGVRVSQTTGAPGEGISVRVR